MPIDWPYILPEHEYYGQMAVEMVESALEARLRNAERTRRYARYQELMDERAIARREL